MSMTLYELAGAEVERRFSPYVWRVRLALAHKGLEARRVPLRFTEMAQLDFSGDRKVPVLVDGTKVVRESWDIAGYLEDEYADRPSLFGGAQARAQALFFNHWTDTTFFRALVPMIIMDIFNHVAPQDRDYFRASREARFGARLEDIPGDRARRLAGFGEMVTPLRETLAAQPFLCGDSPAHADYIVFSGFQFARIVSDLRLLAEDDPIHAWRERMLDLFDGLGRQTLAYPLL